MKQLSINIFKNLILATIYIAATLYIVQNKAPILLPAVFISLLTATIIITIINSKFSKLAHIIFILYSTILAIQIITIILTGNYIDSIALSNLDEYTSISASTRLKIATTIISYVICAIFIKQPPTKYSKKLYLLLILLLTIICANLPQKNNLPITSFINTAYTTTVKYYQQQQTNNHIKEQQKKLYGKDYIIEQPDKHLISDVPNLSGKNLVIFFTEALSSKKIDLFNNYPNLTPNLSAFINKSLYFDNYYNHTFTTYRGLRGQLSSSYQYTGVVKAESSSASSITKIFTSELTTLPQILNQNGYNTYFLSGRASSPSNLNFMLNTLGFKHVFTPEDFGINSDLTDFTLFRELTELIIQKKLQEPYFIAIYNIGTHFAEDSPDLKYQDGKNSLLNNIHNFDNAFGRWFNTIATKPDIADKLAIILTADHAAFANTEYRQTYKDEPQVWVDKIPLAIYQKNITPKVINAHGRNSLDFAPTILHMMNINKAKNYFLGCSLFKLYCPLPYEYYTIGGEIHYQTSSYGTHYLSEDNYPKHIINKIENFYHLSESIISEDYAE